MGIKEFFETLFYICKDKKDKWLLFIGGALMLGYYFYNYISVEIVFDSSILRYFFIILCVGVILGIMSFINMMILFSAVMMTKKNGEILSRHSLETNSIIETFSKPLNSIIEHLTGVHELCQDTKDAVDMIDVGCEDISKSTLETIHLINLGLTYKYMSEMVMYNMKVHNEVLNNVDVSSAKLMASSILENNLKGIRNTYLDSIYESSDLSVHIKNDIISLLNDINMEVEKEILAEKSIEEKVSSMLILNKNFDTNIMTLIKKYLI